ncbi:acetate/propionate family kinase [Rhizobium lentis]|uniref:acetate/propionate family kinase n=1 Tax=Rhizobium lentis TaxID=1138194 RepID=UPI001C82BFD7|nr:acetate kinase [Rhizobium lentis]MBX4999555.1 acetate kinase [Rhizobium lentis]MBX5017296.1 acetate kinase [Rhizobium lentis]
MDTVLVVNAGSSSLKFEVFSIEGGLSRRLKGQMEGVGTAPRLRIKGATEEVLADHQHSQSEVPDLQAAMRLVGAWLRESHEGRLVAVGHRVVHGGPEYGRPVLIDEKVLADLEHYVPLAPLHQPNNLAPIRAILARRPDLPQVACFDTSFHRGHSAVADHYAIPERFFAEGVRRYGFHGLSYEYVASRLPELAPEIAPGRVVVAHLGSGASMCALFNGRSVESTLGFTALDGLPMGTRCGQIDPGVILYLLNQKGMTPDQIQDLLYKDSGLKGLSGVSNDVRSLLESEDSRAAFALEHFVHRIGLNAGMLAAALGGMDGFVFTAGIGENSPEMRKRIVEKLEWLGAKLDPERNAAGHLLISTADSWLRVYVVPTDEELMIARHTLASSRA